MTDVVVIFTCKTENDLMNIGGTGWWKVSRDRVMAAGQVLVVHNAHDQRKPGNPKLHGHPQFYATVRRVHQDDDDRCLIQFERFAKASGVFRWPGFRNPVAYLNANEVLRMVERGSLRNMPMVPVEKAQSERRQWDARHAIKNFV